MLAVLGLLANVALVVTAGVGFYNAATSGSWRDWGILEWVVNIANMCFMIFPFFNVFGAFSKGAMAVGGGLVKLLSKVPLIGRVATYVREVAYNLRTWSNKVVPGLFAEGGFLTNFGRRFSKLADLALKHPYIAAGLIFASSTFDGIVQRMFQAWGDLSLKAANFAYERLGQIMSEDGYGDPVTQAVDMMNTSSTALPTCFVDIWGAVGASECIGLIVTTFEYMFLLSALLRGYKVYNK